MLTHSLADVFSKFANESHRYLSDWLYMGATILVAIAE